MEGSLEVAGAVERIYGVDFFGTREPYPFLRDVLRQIDVLLEGRESEWDEFGLGVMQGLCVAAALQRRREDIYYGWGSFYSWDDMRAIRERGCLRELRSRKFEAELEMLYETRESLIGGHGELDDNFG